jgi:hypothetical protein
MKSKLFTKVLSREMPLIAVESLDIGFTKRNSDFFDISFPESVFVYRNKLFECYRDKEMFNDIPRKFSEIKDISVFSVAISKIKESINNLHVCLKE